MPDRSKKHLIRIEQFAAANEYTYPREGGSKFSSVPRNRAVHGNKLKSRLEEIRTQFEIDQETELPEGIVRDDVIYAEFYSAWGFKDFKFEQLNENREREYYQLLSVRKEFDSDDVSKYRYRITVMLREGGISHFLSRIDKYLQDSPQAIKPKGNDLFANIEDIKLATLEAFWTDGDFNPFPQPEEKVWWEVWFRKARYSANQDRIIDQLINMEVKVGESHLEFAEHVVKLIMGTPSQLASSLMLLDSLAELRKPQEVNDFITNESITYTNQQEWLEDLKKRTELKAGGNETLVCLLDSGVNNKHFLLEPLIPDEHLYTWKPSWGVADSEPRGGHGTGMAGLALYGDLTEALASSHTIRIYHGIESFKVKHPSSTTDKELFGVIYKDGCYTPIIDRPENQRVYCIAVTNDGIIKSGRPSSSSAAVDSIAFGNQEEGFDPQLIVVSGGNARISHAAEYPNMNFLSSVQDPGQAYNAITVGAFTRKDKLTELKYTPLADYGGMSPNNTTSGAWETQWPNKPDIVMEGGNFASDGYFASSHWELDPVSLDKDFTHNLFIPFGGTSGASALAAKMAAELRSEYPEFWPETIRGLMIHSAEWTEAMLKEHDTSKENGRRALLRSMGYGVPHLKQALYSGDNALTLISEAIIQPFRCEKGGNPKYNEYHLYELPWPKEVLEDELFDKDVRLKVTLSYFVEPNPGGREYAYSYSYHSHTLDFNLIKPGEKPEEFKRRISAAADWPKDEKYDGTSEEWTINRVGNKGSIRKDFLDTNGAELATRNLLAIYPKNGWYRTRKVLEKYDSKVRYSLIVSLETEIEEVDIYTPVENMVAVSIKV